MLGHRHRCRHLLLNICSVFLLIPVAAANHLREPGMSSPHPPPRKLTLRPARPEFPYPYTWDYHRLGSWLNDYPDCEKEYQSPIDIRPARAVNQPATAPLTFTDYSLVEGDVISIARTNHVVKVTFATLSERVNRTEPRGVPRLSLGSQTYILDHIIIHSGVNYTPDGGIVYQGSEHRIDNRVYPLEVQLYHYNPAHESFVAASEHADAILAISVLYQHSARETAGFHQLVKYAGILREPGSNPHRANVETNFTFLDLISAGSNEQWRPGYYLYSGSLTQPPCYETATWVVMADPSNISTESLQVFASLLLEDAQDSHVKTFLDTKSNMSGLVEPVVVNNTRAVQMMHGRPVYYHHGHLSGSARSQHVFNPHRYVLLLLYNTLHILPALTLILLEQTS